MKNFILLLLFITTHISIYSMDTPTHGNLRVIRSEDGWNILDNYEQNSRSQTPKLPIDLESNFEKEQELSTINNPIIIVEHKSTNSSCEDLSKLEHNDYHNKKTINHHDFPRLSAFLEQGHEQKDRKNASPKPEDIFKLPTFSDIFYFLPCIKKEKKS